MAAPLSAAELHRELLADFQQPIGGIAVFVNDGVNETGCLRLLHSLSSYPGTPGVPSADRLKTFTYSDDVEGIDILSIAFEEAILNTTSQVNVAGSPERHQELLDEEPDDEKLEPFNSNDANTRTLKTRLSMFVPFEFAGLVIGEQLNARQAFEVLYPAISDAGLEDVCKPLLDFLMVANSVLPRNECPRSSGPTGRPRSRRLSDFPTTCVVQAHQQHVSPALGTTAQHHRQGSRPSHSATSGWL